MKNVIVFALDQRLFAVELRWVREMFTLGYVTPIPSAPRIIDGVVNLRGAITPIIDLDRLLAGEPADGIVAGEMSPLMPNARRGDGAILLEVEALTAAFRISNVEEVSTLLEGPEPDTLIDSRGRQVALLDPRQIVERAIAAVDDARGLQPTLVEAARG